jgi:hypothetical protein
MTVIAVREVSVHTGKEDLVNSRIRRAAGIMARHGASTKIFKIVGGAGVGNFHLQAIYNKVADGAKAFQSFSNDPEFHTLTNEISTNPGGEVNGPQLYRYAYGAPDSKPRPVVVIRQYHMPRKNLSKAMELAPQLDELMKPMDVGIGIGVPLLTDDHEMMGVIYRFNSMEHWGESVDQMLENESFANLINSANEFGTLRNSRLMTIV